MVSDMASDIPSDMVGIHICFIIPNKMQNTKRGKNTNRDFG